MAQLRLLLVVLIIALVLGGWSVGQDKKNDKKEPAVKLKGQLPPNWRKLGLSEEQVQKVYRIQADYDAKISALEAQIKQLKTEERAELMKVLTDAQKARLKEITEGKNP
ncbi:MAG TPA: hypothetical protein VNK04_02365 [Gemmataceae bacterium]|nr:hypothetical protein [Gemmataceae bacterium]